MTNSDRYSPDDYNADQIDEDAVEQQGTVKAKSGKTKPVAGKRKLKASTSGPKPGTVATRAKRTDSDQDKKKAGAKATVNSVSANSAKKPAKKTVKKTATNRVGKADVVYDASAATGDAAHTVTWQLAGRDAAAFGINDQGEIWFRELPNYESERKSFSSDLIASAANGQLTDRETVRINITDVDEVPSEMRLGTTERTIKTSFDTTRGLKLTVIKFKDDALGTNLVAINQSEIFEIRQDKQESHFQLWLKPRVELLAGEYQIEIRPDVSGEGTPPKPQIFALTITTPIIVGNDLVTPVAQVVNLPPYVDDSKVPDEVKEDLAYAPLEVI